ncbi:MAG: single-stranded DNA-binding protein [Nevskia sp.]|nr:single-stranded DNA-binding protein [Nevskia sp.]
MSNRFEGSGNLGDAPALKRVRVGDEQRPVLELSIYFDRRVPAGEGAFVEKGGFWLNCNLWGKRAEQAAPLLTKGARVYAIGDLELETWEDEGTERSAFRLNLDQVLIDPLRVVDIKYRESRGKPGDDETAAGST